MKSLAWNTLIVATALIGWATAASAEETTLVFATASPANSHLSVQFFHP